MDKKNIEHFYFTHTCYWRVTRINICRDAVLSDPARSRQPEARYYQTNLIISRYTNFYLFAHTFVFVNVAG